MKLELNFGDGMKTRTEKEYMDRVAQLTCAACGEHGVQIHHIRNGTMGKRSGNALVIPLCPECHTGGFSIHMTPKEFQGLYGSELEMLNETILMVFDETCRQS